MSFPNRNALWAHVLADALARSGVRHVCLSPGSRSTPLSLAALHHPALASSVHHDERGAAFFALGLARTSRTPVALVCTSGTAAANYLPAVVEASLSNVPLLVLTADRPPEARGWGAAQTIDQVELYGRYARWSVDLPVPEPTPSLLAFLAQTVGRAVDVALSSPRGPVHLNVPLRDPLPPIALAGDVPPELPPLPAPLRTHTPRGRPADAELRPIAAELAQVPHGIISVGPGDAEPGLADALAQLARATGWPILAEATSSLRHGPHTLAHGELLARNAGFAASHTPQLALRLGQALTPRALIRYVDGAARTVLVDAPGRWVDAGHRATLALAGDPAATLGRLAELVREHGAAVDAAWAEDFQRADALAEAALVRALDAEAELGELHAARDLFDATPADAPLWIASSMPIRDLESAAGARELQVLANRGANGIDGTIASALGAAQARGGRAALLIGDVALLHDLNSLLTAKLQHLALTVVLVNNDGGGIFSFLEVAQAVPPEPFERLWGTPHGVAFAGAVTALGGRFRTAATRDDLRRALAESFARREPGADVIEVCTDRAANVAAHRRVFAAVDAALEGQAWRASS